MWATRSRVCFLFKSFCLSSLSDSQEWQNEKKSRFKKQFSKVVLPLNWDIAREAGCRQKVGAATDWIYPPRKRKRKNGCKQTSTQHCNALLAPESRIDSTGERANERDDRQTIPPLWRRRESALGRMRPVPLLQWRETEACTTLACTESAALLNFLSL